MSWVVTFLSSVCCCFSVSRARISDDNTRRGRHFGVGLRRYVYCLMIGSRINGVLPQNRFVGLVFKRGN